MEDNMKRISLLLFVILLLPIGLFAQTKNINFTYDVLSIPKSIIFIDSVIDSRDDTNRIGSAEFENMKKVINFKTGAKDAFFKYLSFNIPKKYYYTPIIVEIRQLNVIKEKTSNYDSIKTSLILGFSTKQFDSTIQLYQANATNQINAKDGFKDLEISIKSCLEQCFTEFINNKKQEIDYYKMEKVYPITKVEQSPQNQDLLTEEKKTTQSFSLISLGYDYGLNASGFSFSYYQFRNHNNDYWNFPSVISFEMLNIHSNSFSNIGAMSASLQYFKPGVMAMKNIYTNTYLGFRFQLPIGYEQIDDDIDRFLIGIYLSQGIYSIPTKGVTVGFSLFEYVSSSKVYRADLGVKVEMGIKF